MLADGDHFDVVQPSVDQQFDGDGLAGHGSSANAPATTHLMRRLSTFYTLCSFAAAAIAVLAAACGSAPEPHLQRKVAALVQETIEPLMREHQIPGMAIAIAMDGRRFVFTFGEVERGSARPVTADTLFEIGSISKVFTATLAAYAQAAGTLSLDDVVSAHLPALAGTAFDQVRLLDLGTYTAGGLPLQFPEGVTDEPQLLAYWQNWRPSFAAGTHRLYSNPSLGLFGELAAHSLGAPFPRVMETLLLPSLALSHTYLRVPAELFMHYAWGCAADGTPVRVAPGLLDAPTYGIKTTASDLLRFVELNMNGAELDVPWQQALAALHAGYFTVGGMTQGLGWEMYADPTDLAALLAGNAPNVLFEANEVVRFAVPQPPSDRMLLNKTGSTNGFGAYVAFIPSQRLGVVLLANKNYPIAARVQAAHRLLMALMT